MEIKGKVFEILPVQSGQGKNGEWRKGGFVLEVPGNYPKKVAFDVWGDNIENFKLRQNEEIMVRFDIESREYQGKWYTSAKAWGVQREQSQEPESQENHTQRAVPSADEEPPMQASVEDDLPF